ncbi:MAG: hypothetical protein QM780_07685 [Hyphomicrobium sp.]|uniref:hypothetical protein n=1 Tax=Hyphomicrobium sp. TaxID=82 RepID=UPI0039E503E0
MFRKLSFVLAAMVAACFSQSAANANTVNLSGDTDYTVTLSHTANPSFTDFINFTTGTTAGGSVSLLGAATPPASPTSYFTQLTFELLAGSTVLATGNLLSYATFFLPLAANTSYSLHVIGDSVGSSKISYVLDLATTPVPPALILFGSALLGMVGLASRSRKKWAQRGFSGV